MAKIYIESYGCASSQSDARIMAGILGQSHTLTKRLEEADVVVLNTCIVKRLTEFKMFKRISELEKNHKPLIIAGCMPETHTERLRQSVPRASLLSTNLIYRVNDAVDTVLNGKRIELIGKNKRSKVCLPTINKKPIDIVEICRGCNYACNYCITKLAKGDFFSYPYTHILKRINNSINNGFNEIWLTGQDIAAYSYRGFNLPTLLNRTNFYNDHMIRLGMMNPASVLPILDELIESYANPNIFKFLHIPVQSGSDKILKAMNRKYSVSDFKKIIKSFRAAIPEITIWTDIIVGFPGETEQDFKATLSLIEATKPDFVNISKFSPRPGTLAAKLPELPAHIKNERSRLASDLVAHICLEKNRVWEGWCGRILIDEWNSGKKSWVGRNFAYKPVVINTKSRLGQLTNVKIISATKSHLLGEQI